MTGRTIPDQESLRVEFKSDACRLSDAELVETAVCMANTEGGEIFLGVEDDATPEEMIRRYIREHGIIRRRDVIEL